jgi:hypothetical protein
MNEVDTEMFIYPLFIVGSDTAYFILPWRWHYWSDSRELKRQAYGI